MDTDHLRIVISQGKIV